MKRRKFIMTAAAGIAATSAAFYAFSDKSNFVRSDDNTQGLPLFPFQLHEEEILSLASLAPSGHNSQPWTVKYVQPYHWIICNDKSRWLPGVDPDQRETMLSIGAFMQNLEYASDHFGYSCAFTILASSNKDEEIVEIKLSRSNQLLSFDPTEIKMRRTVRSGFLTRQLDKADVAFITSTDKNSVHYFPNGTQECSWLNQHTIEANRIQAYRDEAQKELASWIRFSSKDAALHQDGLTLAGMEIDGIPGWYLRNFYSKENVMRESFREQSIRKVVSQVSKSAGWLLITCNDDTVSSLLDTGMRLQSMWLKCRKKNIAIHPMTQVIEEALVKTELNKSLGISESIQFVLRTGYLESYPAPVSLRRPCSAFVKNNMEVST